MRTRLVIIGGGPAGLEAARAFREAGAEGDVTLVSVDEHLPYERPPLSKDFLRGESEESQLPIEDEKFYASKSISVKLCTRALELDPDRHRLTLSDGTNLNYGTCILATGASPTTLAVPGGDAPGLFYLRSRHDARRLRQAAAATSSHSAVVVGSGFIGCEAASSLARRGLMVTLVTKEERPQVDRLGKQAGRLLRKWLQDEGVIIRSEVEVAEIDESRLVRLSDGSTTEGDFVLIAAGVKPEAGLARSAGLDVVHERVRVDTHMRSCHPDILAAGDVALAYNTGAGRHLAVEHWGEALAMGRIAGETAAGRMSAWEEVPGFWSTIGDRTLKYAAWGDGFDGDRLVEHGAGSFTIWYERNDIAVGVLTHDADADYELGQDLIGRHQPPP
jgi:3-phenylpropionate/trans-cinnamate dioxygenase ferredoxin reductase component